jgi:hypothetical protein
MAILVSWRDHSSLQAKDLVNNIKKSEKIEQKQKQKQIMATSIAGGWLPT